MELPTSTKTAEMMEEKMKTDSIVSLVKHVDQKQSSGTKRDRISDQVRPCKGMVVTNLELTSVGLVRKMGMCRVTALREE